MANQLMHQKHIEIFSRENKCDFLVSMNNPISTKKNEIQMPIIVDANRCGDFSDESKFNAGEILKRISKRQIRITVGGELLKELSKTRIRQLLVEWTRIGQTLRVDNAQINSALSCINTRILKSNDAHVVALSIASNTMLIYTDDSLLIQDLKNSMIVTSKRKIIKSTTRSNIVSSLLNRYNG